jgi:hypothetical protein
MKAADQKDVALMLKIFGCPTKASVDHYKPNQ